VVRRIEVPRYGILNAMNMGRSQADVFFFDHVFVDAVAELYSKLSGVVMTLGKVRDTPPGSCRRRDWVSISGCVDVVTVCFPGLLKVMGCRREERLL
jgi:hypothetical protein